MITSGLSLGAGRCWKKYSRTRGFDPPEGAGRGNGFSGRGGRSLKAVEKVLRGDGLVERMPESAGTGRGQTSWTLHRMRGEGRRAGGAGDTKGGVAEVLQRNLRPLDRQAAGKVWETNCSTFIDDSRGAKN